MTLSARAALSIALLAPASVLARGSCPSAGPQCGEPGLSNDEAGLIQLRSKGSSGVHAASGAEYAWFCKHDLGQKSYYNQCDTCLADPICCDVEAAKDSVKPADKSGGARCLKDRSETGYVSSTLCASLPVPAACPTYAWFCQHDLGQKSYYNQCDTCLVDPICCSVEAAKDSVKPVSESGGARCLKDRSETGFIDVPYCASLPIPQACPNAPPPAKTVTTTTSTTTATTTTTTTSTITILDPKWMQVTEQINGKCLTYNAESPDKEANATDCTGSDNQLWEFSPDASGAKGQLIVRQDGLCLTMRYPLTATASASNSMWWTTNLAPCDGDSVNQLFTRSNYPGNPSDTFSFTVSQEGGPVPGVYALMYFSSPAMPHDVYMAPQGKEDPSQAWTMAPPEAWA